MKTEIPGLEIAVVNHLENWNNYHDTVRNDNLSNPNYADADSLNCGWFSPDGLHPNGRGNIAMFQQIIKELNLYQANSELANFSGQMPPISKSLQSREMIRLPLP